jgi:outer membrane protein TolC
MIMKKKIVFVLSLLMIFSNWGKAQQKQAFDLEGAKKQAIQYNRMLKNSAFAVDKAQFQLKEAIAAGLPQISSTLNYSNALGAKLSIRFDPNAPATEIPIKPTSQFNLQVGQLLFNGSYFVGLELARLGKTLTEKNYEKTEQDVLAQVTGSYYLVLVSGELLNLMNKNVTNLKEVYRKTEAMVNVGMLEKTDLDQLGVQIAALQNAVSNAGRQLEFSKNMFRLQLGLDVSQDFELTNTLEQVMGMVKGTLNAQNLFDLTMNKDYQLVELQEQMSQKQIKMQNSAYLPTLNGFYSRTEKIIKPNFDMSPKNMLGANLSIPIFSGGQRKAKVDQAKIDLETIRNTKAFMAEQLQIQEKQLQYNLKSANETYLNQMKNLDVAKSVYDNLKRKFEQGMISGLELVSADNNYVKAETDYISSVFQVLQATVELDKINGKLK